LAETLLFIAGSESGVKNTRIQQQQQTRPHPQKHEKFFFSFFNSNESGNCSLTYSSDAKGRQLLGRVHFADRRGEKAQYLSI
jgi:hypothetical protein